MNCADHKNEEMPHCPSCLAKYWEDKYKRLKTDYENSAQEAAYRWRFQKRLAKDPTDTESRWVRICENNASDIERWFNCKKSEKI